MPGHDQPQLWFQATKTGEFEIGCAQHCGVNHYKMQGMLTVARRRGLRRSGCNEAVGRRRARATTPNDTDAHWGWDWES